MLISQSKSSNRAH